MDVIALDMRDIITNNYFDSYDKYLCSMFIDAFCGVDLFCAAVQRVYVSQAGIIIRQLLEQVSIVQILVTRLELLPSFINHYNFKIEINNLSKEERKEKIIEKFKVSKSNANENFLDYGWINPSFNEDKMIEFAGFGDFIIWKQKYLNKFAHSSFVTTSAICDGEFPIIDEFIHMVAKLFDHLCCAFHNYTGFDFIINNIDLFTDFRNKYKNYIG